MTAPTREQITQWALDCGLVEQRDVDNCTIDALFDDLQCFSEIDLRRFAELAYAAGQAEEREACAAMLDQMEEEAEQDVVELLVKLQERCDELLKQRDELLKQRDELLSALVGYGHKFGCGKNAFGAECTCGIGALIDSVKGGAE